MNVLTYTSYKEHYDLFNKMHGTITIHSFQVGLAQKDIILLSKNSSIVNNSDKQTSVRNTELIKFTLSEGTYSIDDFNAKVKMSIPQQRQGWESLHIKDLNLLIPKTICLRLAMRFFTLLI